MLDSKELLEAKVWVNSELKVSDLNIMYIEDGDDRSVSSIVEWRSYRKLLRDYVKGGNVCGTPPVRPIN